MIGEVELEFLLLGLEEQQYNLTKIICQYFQLDILTEHLRVMIE